MKRSTTIRTLILSALALALFAAPQLSAAAEQGHLDTIAKALDASTLTKAEQIDVRVQAGAAVNAGIAAEDVEIIVTRAVKRGADAETMTRLLHIAQDAKEAGLPAGPVVDRIEQGLSKGVPLGRVASASERLARKLGDSRPLVDALIQGGVASPGARDRELAIASGARALEKSINAEAIEKIGTLVREKRGTLQLLTSALDTATYLAGSGMSPDTAVRLVQHAVEKGYTERDLDTMAREIDAEVRRGAGAEDAAARMERDTMQGGGAGVGRRDIQTDRGRGAGSGPSGMGGPRR